MTQRLDKIKMDKVRGPNSKLVTNGSNAQKENKHSSPDKIRRLHCLCEVASAFLKACLNNSNIL